MARSRNPTTFGSMDDIRKVFNKFDKNGDGKISCSEVVESLSELGTKISPAEVELIMKEFDKDGDGYIDLDEFVHFIQNGGLGDSGGNDSKELRDAFDLYDKNKNGLISVDELHSVMTMLGLKCSLSDCRNMIREVDQDGDGNVNFEEFKKMMTKGEEKKSYLTLEVVIDWLCRDTNIGFVVVLLLLVEKKPIVKNKEKRFVVVVVPLIGEEI